MTRNQPRPEDDEDGLQKPERTPSFLTAKELQARAPAKAQPVGETEETSKGKRRKKPH